MLAQFPKERETKREVLLAQVERIASTLQASGAKSEELAALAPEAVAALRDAGLFASSSRRWWVAPKRTRSPKC